ncbi:50S ribosomal protein L25 [Omnitrophica bacterium]|nr:50S ribosomal protein L25 [Candidatus Omnitrophota bacterium]
MERIKLNAELRQEVGKNKVKKLRNKDFVPACLYKGQGEAKNLKVNKRSLFEVLHTKAGENVIVDLILDDKSKKPRPVMVKEVQYHPIREEILHVDFNEISLTKAIKVNVPIVSKGEPEAVTKEDGTLEHVMWEVEVECLPTNIPEKIEVEVGQMKIGDKIHIKDLPVPPDVKILNDPELTVISAEPPHVEEVKEEVLEGEEVTEPEVITKGKKEEEEVEAAGEKAPPPKKEAKKEAKKEEKKKE